MFDFGIITIYWYGFFLALAMTAAIFVALKIGKKKSFKENDLLDLFFYLIIGGLLGARIYDIFLELPYYIQDPLQVFRVWEGGLAIHGGIIAGLIILIYFARKKKLNFWDLSLVLVPALALGQAIGRFGNYFNQELFGLPSNLPWSIFISPENRPLGLENFSHFHPTFLYESLGCLLIFLILLIIIKKQKNKSQKNIFPLAFYVLSYSILRFSLEFIRIDRAPDFLGLRWPQIMSLIMIIGSLYLFFLHYNTQKNETKEIN